MAASQLLDRPLTKPGSSLARGVAVVQGLYFLATGVWPLVSIDTFLRVTGPKTDLWLLETVGLLVGVIGIALLVAARRALSAEAVFLAIGAAVALTMIDVFYVSRRVIPPVYLLDVLAELAFLIAWAAAAWQINRRSNTVRFPAPGLQS
ncbi:MAG TPA: hypothetical protein VH120_04220 [Gemmataceae bacterium]|jgi:hypothetical protein|nr:hypothetical protein [Gemmataceae bacterium]